MKYPSPDELVAVRVDSKEYEDIFVDHLLNLYEHSNDKNKDWWPFLLENWDTRFERWYMTLHGKKIAYFSAVQKMPWKTEQPYYCLLYTSPSPRDKCRSRMPSSA